jgi:hypothetical protein
MSYLKSIIFMINSTKSFNWIWKAVVIKLCALLISVSSVLYFDIVKVFHYPDFLIYAKGDHIAPNFLFGYLINYMDAVSISDPRLIFLSILFSIIIDILALNLFSRYFKINKKILIIYFIFTLHPYFALYSLRFDTLDFASLSCIIFLYLLDCRHNKVKVFILLFILLFLSAFRISSLVFFISAVVASFCLRDKYKLTHYEKFYLMCMSICVCFIFYQNGIFYITTIIDAPNQFALTLKNNQIFFGSFGVMFDAIIFSFTKIITLFGGREALYTEGLEYIYSSTFGIFQLIIFSFLAIFHIFCLIQFVKYASIKKQTIPVILTFIIFLLALLTVGHMRYVLPYHSMILIGLIYYVEVNFGKDSVNPSLPA